MNESQMLLYTTDDAVTRIELALEEGTVWLNQADIANLFNTTKQNVSLHLKNIFADGELNEKAVVKESLTTASDGKNYHVKMYALDAILAVGYRVRSPRGAQFRQWANTVLKEYLIKGFAMDDARLKQAERWDYFDEWLARIRDIRASEKRFYQKVRDLYATAVDYNKRAKESQLFFKQVQNKMLWAVTGHTAAELIAARSNPDQTNMGLTNFKGSIVRKGDVGTAKNYLNEAEVSELNRIVTMYLDYAEDQAQKRQAMTMAQWLDKLDAFLTFNERELLTHAGKIRMDVAKKLAEERYASFDHQRKQLALSQADAEDMAVLETMEKRLKASLKKTP